MSAPDPGKIQKFREIASSGMDRRPAPSAAFNVSMEERPLFTDWALHESPRRPRAHFPEPRYSVVVEQNRHRSRVPEHDKRRHAGLVSGHET